MYLNLSRQASLVVRNVRSSSDVGGYTYFQFSPDIDLLEVRADNVVVGYELKGYRRKTRSIDAPQFYEGIDQALAYLLNPVSSPLASTFVGSIFDYVYVVHPGGSQVEKLGPVIRECTPLGLIVVDRGWSTEIVEPRKNPFLNEQMKSFFLGCLDRFKTYMTYSVNPIQ